MLMWAFRSRTHTHKHTQILMKTLMMPLLLHTIVSPRKQPWHRMCVNVFVPILTSGRELFGVDDFGGVLLACAEFDTAAHHWEGPPGKQRQGDRRRRWVSFVSIKSASQLSGWPHSCPRLPLCYQGTLIWMPDTHGSKRERSQLNCSGTLLVNP